MYLPGIFSAELRLTANSRVHQTSGCLLSVRFVMGEGLLLSIHRIRVEFQQAVHSCFIQSILQK